MQRIMLSVLLTASVLASGCGYNELQTKDESTKAAWAEVVNQYQRRADLIPNLVNTVKGYAAHEKDVLVGVTEARAKATQVRPNIDDPEEMEKYMAAQGEVTGALSRLLVVAEKYPDLKADQNFRDLQAQLEGTENRVTVARNRFITTVQDYNNTVRSFPTNLTAMVIGAKVKPTFTVENESEIAKPPVVDFGSPGAAKPGPPPAVVPPPPPPPASSVPPVEPPPAAAPAMPPVPAPPVPAPANP
jgi:LemA protein